MQIRGVPIAVLKVAIAAVMAGCGGGAGGKLMVDTPVLPYQPPDIDEITGIDSDDHDTDAAATGSAAGSAASTTTEKK